MMKNIAKLALAIVIAFATQCLVLAAEHGIPVAVSVPAISGIMEVTISSVAAEDPVDLADDVWTKGASSVNFGTLTRDTVNKIFRGDAYYAVDVAVIDNTGRSWTLTHAVSPVRLFRSRLNENLDESINVAFAKVIKPRGTTTDEETLLSRGTYKESDKAQFNRATLEGGKGGWLRIYYGIATGNTDSARGSTDPAGAFPVAQHQQAGLYRGGVTLTLTPQ